MNNYFASQLEEVKNHFDANDISVGNRRLTDCALETNNNDIFKSALEYYQWLEAKEQDTNVVKDKALDLLTKIERAGLIRPENSAPLILQAEGVHKKYGSNAYAFGLKPVDFNLNTGEIIGLVGENGNGKTTLLRLLAKELKPDGGSLQYAMDKGNDYDLRTRLVYIEQRIPRWYGSLMNNLQFTLATYGISGESNYLLVEMMMARLGLRPFRSMNWKSISSGYRTRFELARALLRRPKILLLDEPLANLDIMAQQTILQDLKFMASSLRSPFGMVLSSQHIYEVEKVSDTIIFLKNGTPQYQRRQAGDINETVEEAASPVIYEIETVLTRDELIKVFAGFSVDKITYNGGVYTVYFSSETQAANIFQAIAAANMPVKYLRDITHSSRRFFNN